jgi:hypothetical protein
MCARSWLGHCFDQAKLLDKSTNKRVGVPAIERRGHVLAEIGSPGKAYGADASHRSVRSTHPIRESNHITSMTKIVNAVHAGARRNMMGVGEILAASQARGHRQLSVTSFISLHQNSSSPTPLRHRWRRQRRSTTPLDSFHSCTVSLPLASPNWISI